MKMKLILTLVLVLLTGGYLLVAAAGCKRQGTDKTASQIYYCTMHPQVTSDKLGKCPICHMDLVLRPTAPASAHESFYIDQQKQQLSGIKIGKVEKRRLSGTIETVGRVASDTDLYVTQEEYLQAGKSGNKVFADVARRKLLLQGMSEDEIRRLDKQGKPEEGLYLPGARDKTLWVYATIYEYQAALVKEGQTIEVTNAAYPGEVFKGKVVSISPVVEAMTRSLKVRARVENPRGRLKLEMYVDVKLTYDLGEKVSVPAEAVMNAGRRQYVFVADGQGSFKAVDVKLGAKGDGWYEILSGLDDGAQIVTSGNFLVDSESKLTAAISQASEPNSAGRQ